MCSRPLCLYFQLAAPAPSPSDKPVSKIHAHRVVETKNVPRVEGPILRERPRKEVILQSKYCENPPPVFVPSCMSRRVACILRKLIVAVNWWIRIIHRVGGGK